MTTQKQSQLIDSFKDILKANALEITVNHVPSGNFSGEVVALDVEHDESGGFVGCGILPVGGGRVYYFSDLLCLSRCDFQSISIIAHNGITDLECLRQWGIDVKDNQLLWDTMVIGHIIDSSLKSYGLKAMATRDLAITYPTYDDIVGKRTLKQSKERITLDKQPMELVAMYNACDCYVTAELYKKQTASSSDRAYFDNIEKPVSQIFNAMSNRGIRVDLNYLKILRDNLERQKAPIVEQITNELGNINLNSPKQLIEALHAKEIFPVLKGKPSTDKRALGILSDSPIVANLLAFSELETLLSSFVRPYLERGQEYVHPFFNQCGTRTGRLSCSNPNLLQIPRRTENGKLVRRMFIPRDGMLMGDCDFGQIEPRVLAHLSKDPVLCGLFNSDVDFHAFTAERLGITRDRAKVLNLSVGYRATFKSVSAQLKCSDQEAQNEIDKWWDLFPTLRRWQDTLVFEAKRSGLCTTLLGRRIRVDGLDAGNKWKREAAERQLINNITQGSAAEIMKKAMIGINAVAPQLGLLVQVYDELVFESSDMDADMACVEVCMIAAVKLDVPLTVDCGTGPNWAESKG